MEFLLLPFHLILILILSSSSYLQPPVTASAKHGNLTDLEALLNFRAHADPHGILASNWTTDTSFCSWAGVHCSRRRQRVAGIRLEDLGLQGTISPHLGNLSFLSDLYLSNLLLSGTIPQSIGYLPRLTTLVLQENSLTGPFPSIIFNMSSLITLGVADNNLSGSLPSNNPSNNNSFMMPRQLRRISLDGNRFTGTDILSCFLQCRDIQIISLDDNQFSGTIPVEIDGLSKLSNLHLGGNQLTGTIPSSLGNLTELTVLYLHNNSLTGPIPESIGHLPRLIELSLQDNSLTGPLPSNIFNMSSLLHLYAGYNNLSGSLPSNNNFTMPPRLRVISIPGNCFTDIDVLSNFLPFQELQTISLSENQFSGTIPAGIACLSKLDLLHLGTNRLTGTIPSLLGNLTKLTELQLDNNNFSGIIPDELGNLANLQVLNLYGNNNIAGSIPTSLLNISMLYIFDLGKNKLTGSVPSGIGKSLSMLKWFNVGGNQLSGGLEFLSSLSSCKSLKYLQIFNNTLEGVLPNDVGNLSTNLGSFYACENRIKGNIPSTLGNLSGLIVLNLRINELTGIIPSTLVRLESLQLMDLSFNSISGLVPSELGRMKKLNQLAFNDNKLFGRIPKYLANISMLQYLFLSNNKFSADIPKSLWTLSNLLVLDLSRNNLTGSLPPQVAHLTTLISLDLSMNLLSGSITSNLGELSMLTDLNLSKNTFQGQIPESFGGLISATSINLSYNYLSGPIPKSLANLHYLDSVDLSFNMLEGQVPEGRVFLNSSIPSLIGNEALCGASQLHIPPCNNVMKNNLRRELLHLKYMLPVTTLVVALLMLLIYAFYLKRKPKGLPDTNAPYMGHYKVISHHELLCATENFSEANLVGRGGFGSVFKGCLDDGLVVAVKVLNLEVECSSKCFDVECQVLKTVRHRNLIKILGVCSNLDFKALILEYMPNGNLERWLYSHNYFLNTLQRLNIMVDVSLALEYLHHHHPQVVLHCDLKPTNILLDEEMIARVSDFGIAKLLLGDNKSMTSASVPGTLGYIAPEYATMGTVSKMGDVYSFGIMLLETFTRKKPVDIVFGEQSNLRESICKTLPNAILDVVDRNILTNDNMNDDLPRLHRCLSSVIELGLLCSRFSPKERIPMTDVAARLQKIRMEYRST